MNVSKLATQLLIASRENTTVQLPGNYGRVPVSELYGFSSSFLDKALVEYDKIMEQSTVKSYLSEDNVTQLGLQYAEERKILFMIAKDVKRLEQIKQVNYELEKRNARYEKLINQKKDKEVENLSIAELEKLIGESVDPNSDLLDIDNSNATLDQEAED